MMKTAGAHVQYFFKSIKSNSKIVKLNLLFCATMTFFLVSSFNKSSVNACIFCTTSSKHFWYAFALKRTSHCWFYLMHCVSAICLILITRFCYKAAFHTKKMFS